ncbi:LLM class flavin-dependent oxidoreductase [Halobium salinum]|uniref:LLM class flavin-dependent oxidoreductase n=1 Tax=Halobium salinum TaxID=1364940 RepID=A0ABD5P9P1_9EURY|nr:LLM class flavin-dependent oxidoreductase [Halobium salinum]
MRLGVLLPEGTADVPLDTAELAATTGYDAIWAGELWGADAFVQLTTVAHRLGDAVSDVALGTAIANVYSRSPAALAAAATTLDSVHDGPVRLGVGPSTPKAIEDLHGASYDRPVRRTHEAAELVHRFTAGEGRVDYDGELFETADFPALDADVPVYTAALGPAARRMTGRVADGWIPHNVPFERLDESFETVAETAREAGRDPSAIDTAPYVPAAVGDDAEAAYEAVRGHLAYYVGSGEGYRKAVATAFPDAADTVAERWRGGDRDGAREAISEGMVDALGVAGTPESARERLREILALDAVDEAILVPSMRADELREGTIRELAPEKL